MNLRTDTAHIRSAISMWKASTLEAPALRPAAPTKVYRYFSEPQFAENLVKGKVWISTLERCRKHEILGQGDQEEASHEYRIEGSITGNGDDPAFQEIARRGGFDISRFCIGATISNSRCTTVIPDAYVLCTSELFDRAVLGPTFGVHCVEISNPGLFSWYVDIALRRVRRIGKGTIGPVIYRDRHYSGLELPPGPIGFVKPAERFGHQREYRMLWTLIDDNPIDHFELDVPEIKVLCRMLPLP